MTDEQHQIKRPEAVFKCGGVKATVWKNTIQKEGIDRIVFSVTIDRTYKEGETWKTTSSFNVNDLPKVRTVSVKAYEFIELTEQLE